MKIIDFHTHLDSHWFDQPLISENEFMEGLDSHGVDKACIYTLMGLYGNCEEANDRLAAHARSHPERLIAFATVDPKEGRAAVEELERRLSDPLFRGVKFHHWLQAVAPSMVKDTTVELLECAARHQAPAVFHDGTPPYCTTLQIAALARWVPDATIVLGHAGLSDYVYAAGQLMQELPNLYACFCGPKAGELQYLIDAAGPEKVVFGSDFGFSDWKMLAERLDDVREAGLDERTLGQVLQGNAARLLGLEKSP